MPSELPEIPLEVRQEWTRLRQIMYEPSSCWLATENSGDRWLTDQYVMLNVTDSPALEDVELPDGPYKIVASKGFEPRKSVPEPDLEAYFGRLAEQAQWSPAEPSEWSVAEHPGKAMLWTSCGYPCLMGESTWTQIKRHHPDVIVEYGHGELNVFRFSVVQHEGCDEDAYCGHRPGPFCFAAGIRVPEGQQEIADQLAAIIREAA